VADHARPDGTLYLVVARRSERGAIGDRDDGALYRSTGRRLELDPRSRCLRERTVRTPLTVDPEDPERLYLSAWGVTRPTATRAAASS
jgi:hypothetical protein